MKKSLAAFFSLLFLFGISIIAIILLAVFLGAPFLFLFFIYEIIAALCVVIVIFSNRRLDVKIRWVGFLVCVPLIGLFSFIFFGRGYPKRVKNKYVYKDVHLLDKQQRQDIVNNAMNVLKEDKPQYERSFMIGVNQQADLPYNNSDAELFDNAAQGWIQIIKDLEQAKDYILINYYIIEDGDLWRNVKKVLEKKVQEGVRVYIIFDFIGCYGTFTYRIQNELIKAGIKCVPYMRMNLPFLNWKSNYRDHRKDISIDGKIGYTGGANLGDEYINLSPKMGLWNDETIRFTGNAVLGLEKIFVSDWKFCTGQNIIDEEPLIGKNYNDKPDKKNELVQINASGPNHANPGNLDILMNIISTAQKRVWLSTPYFVPPVELINLIASTARSGVDVRLVLPGKTDKLFLLDVSKKHTDVLFDSGVKIYTTNKTFNHTKAYLIDDDLSFAGSTNLDYRALFSDQQTMGLIYSKKFNKQLEKRFKNDFRISKCYKTKPSKEHNIFVRFFILLFNWAAPLL